MIACDGIYDRMNTEDVAQTIWGTFDEEKLQPTYHAQMGHALDVVLKESVV